MAASRETGVPGEPRRCRIFRAEKYRVAVTYCRAPELLSLHFHAFPLTLATDSLDNVILVRNIIENAHGLRSSTFW